MFSLQCSRWRLYLRWCFLKTPILTQTWDTDTVSYFLSSLLPLLDDGLWSVSAHRLLLQKCFQPFGSAGRQRVAHIFLFTVSTNLSTPECDRKHTDRQCCALCVSWCKEVKKSLSNFIRHKDPKCSLQGSRLTILSYNKESFIWVKCIDRKSQIGKRLKKSQNKNLTMLRIIRLSE